MKQLYRFEINSNLSLDSAWEELEARGVEVIYSSEDEETKEIFGYWNSDQPFLAIEAIQSSIPMDLPAIDWASQWANHGLNFKDGYVHVDLSEFSEHPGVLRLAPGPGFGDLSHPTTRLVLKLMGQNIHHYYVVDIGCGSGVLTLAAIVLGAPEAYGIDINPEALEHSYLNAKINQMETVCHFSLPTDFMFMHMQPIVVVMNMIMSEQKEAWESIPQVHRSGGLCLTSGIRKEERAAYLEMVSQWGWNLIKEEEEGEWIGFVFNRPQLPF